MHLISVKEKKQTCVVIQLDKRRRQSYSADEVPDTTGKVPDSADKVPDTTDKAPDNVQAIYKYVLEKGFIVHYNR